jgi:hypothetical protein
MKDTVLSADFAYIDIKTGRSKVLKQMKKGKKIPITIKGHITYDFSGDDGTSILFTVEVDNFKTGEPK